MSDQTTDVNAERKTVQATPNYFETAEKRKLPELSDYLRPRYLFGWVWGFVEHWILSRDYRRLASALPFIVVVFGGGAFVWWEVDAPQDELVRAYEKAAASSIRDGETETARIYLESLVKLRPNQRRYTFQLALHLLQHDQQARGLNYLKELVAPGPAGYNPARLWLLTQANDDAPLIPLSSEDIETQLRLVLSEDPTNAYANRALAEAHLRRGQLQQAEDRLLQVVDVVPELGLPLARIQKLLSRSEDTIQMHLEEAGRAFSSQLLNTPESTEARVSQAEVLVLQGRVEEAERTLREGLELNDSTELQAVLARLYATEAYKRVEASVQNRDFAARLLSKAMMLSPTDRGILNQVLMLADLGTTFSESDLQPSIQSLASTESQSTDEKVLLAQLYALTGKLDQATATLTSVSDDRSDVKVMLARLYARMGRKEDSDKLIKQLLEQFQVPSADQPVSEILAYAETLVLAEQAEKGMELLATRLDEQKASSDEQPGISQIDMRRLQVALGRCSILAFDSQLAAGGFSDPETALRLLQTALDTNSVFMPAVQRLARLEASEGDVAEAAGRALTSLLASGAANAEVYNVLGTQALQNGDAARARRYLERAYSLNRSNPMVLNNLALALVRENDSNANRALEITSEALKILPEHPDVLSTRAEVFVAMERWEDARRDLEISLPKRSQSLNSRKLIARVYDELGESALAEEHRRILSSLQTDDASPSQLDN